MNSLITTIIFDFYGVIRADGLRAWLKENGFKFEGDFRCSDELRCVGKINKQEYFEILSKLSSQDQEKIEQRMRDLSTLNKQVLGLVQKLRDMGYKLALLSNSTDSTQEYIESNGIGEYFDEMILSHKIGIIKPNKEIFSYALGKLNITLAEAIFIDDKSENTEVAEQFGIKSIVFKSYKQLVRELERLLGRKIK
ncbi:MAG: HAD family phosphatase [Candidatus Nomurabacteria bacterium]|jgi:epoxide hydrolase-like predicted phosphatase|nr:HAD family phosphatase [Candidatus Nomurabacteria bacterium]